MRTSALYSYAYAYADEIARDGSGKPAYQGEARALGDRAYGKPALWITIVHLAALGWCRWSGRPLQPHWPHRSHWFLMGANSTNLLASWRVNDARTVRAPGA